MNVNYATKSIQIDTYVQSTKAKNTPDIGVVENTRKSQV